MHQIRTIENMEAVDKENQGENKILTQEQTTAIRKFPWDVLHLHLVGSDWAPADYDHVTDMNIETAGSLAPLFPRSRAMFYLFFEFSIFESPFHLTFIKS